MEGASGPGDSPGGQSDANLTPEELQARRTALNQDKNRRAQRRFRQRQKVPCRALCWQASAQSAHWPACAQDKLSDAELQLQLCRKMLGREQDARRKTETENQFLSQVGALQQPSVHQPAAVSDTLCKRSAWSAWTSS